MPDVSGPSTGSARRRALLINLAKGHASTAKSPRVEACRRKFLKILPKRYQVSIRNREKPASAGRSDRPAAKRSHGPGESAQTRVASRNVTRRGVKRAFAQGGARPWD